MPTWVLISIVIVSIIILILGVSIKNTTTFAYTVLPGFYHADADFCKGADLKRMYMYIGQPTSALSCDYPCYLVIQALHGVVLNQKVTANIFEKWDNLSNWNPCLGKNCKYYDISFTDIQLDEFPSKMDMRYDPLTGSIRLFQGEKLYARLYKDNLASALQS